jgi:hypothetical protein
MAKKQQMRWTLYAIQAFLDVRIHVLNEITKMYSDIDIEASADPLPGKKPPPLALPATLNVVTTHSRRRYLASVASAPPPALPLFFEFSAINSISKKVQNLKHTPVTHR